MTAKFNNMHQPGRSFLKKGWGETIRMAFNPFVKLFLQLGHIRVEDPPPDSAFSSVKCTSTKVLSEYSCRVSFVDPGHIGDNFRFLLDSFSVPGVSEGIQKDGKADFASAYLYHSIQHRIHR